MIEAGGVVGRGVRAAALTALALGVSGLAHGVGGMPLGLPGVLVALCALGPLMWAVTTTKLRVGPLLAVLGAGQALAHVSFLIGHGMTAAPSMTHASAPALGVSDAMVSGAKVSGAAHGGHVALQSAPAMLPSGRMLFAHGVATLVLALLLARGEAVLWRVLGSLVRLPAPARLTPVTRPCGIPDRLHISPPALWADARAMRGPPGPVTA